MIKIPLLIYILYSLKARAAKCCILFYIFILVFVFCFIYLFFLGFCCILDTGSNFCKFLKFKFSWRKRLHSYKVGSTPTEYLLRNTEVIKQNVWTICKSMWPAASIGHIFPIHTYFSCHVI